jgi:subtilisin family serine protease
MHSLLRALTAVAVLAAGAALAAPPATPGARIVVTFANPAHAPPAPAGTTGSRYGGEGYRTGQSAQQQAQRLAAAYRLRQVDSWPIQALAMHCVVFEVTDARPLGELLAAVSHQSGVLIAQPLNEFRTLSASATSASATPAYNDPLYDMQTNLTALGIERAHQRTQGAGVRIALIDTGVDVSHPDLRGRIVSTHSYLKGPAPGGSALRHGTAMAGLIAAVANNHIGMVGVAPEARLEVFEACWQLGADADAAACNTFTLARALAGALASGAPLVNLSLAGPADPLLSALVEVGLKRGVIFVAAAAPPEAGFPTQIPGVVAVGGTEQPHAAALLTAPAKHVLTLRPHGEYDFASGSSVAAAQVSGVIALLLAAAPGQLRAAQIVGLLRGNAATVDINAALSRLDASQGGGAANAPARGCAHAPRRQGARHAGADQHQPRCAARRAAVLQVRELSERRCLQGARRHQRRIRAVRGAGASRGRHALLGQSRRGAGACRTAARCQRLRGDA